MRSIKNDEIKYDMERAKQYAESIIVIGKGKDIKQKKIMDRILSRVHVISVEYHNLFVEELNKNQIVEPQAICDLIEQYKQEMNHFGKLVNQSELFKKEGRDFISKNSFLLLIQNTMKEQYDLYMLTRVHPNMKKVE